jgi:predicted ATP-grasp superfamily ATP-dependent carboligase
VARAGELTDKRLQMEVAQRCGIAVPRTWCPESWKALRAIDSPRRLIAKPVTSLAQAPFKALIARDAAELEAQLRPCIAAADEVLVQEYAEGGDDAIYVALAYRARSVERSYVFTGRKLRQSKPGAGIMAVGQALDVPEVRAMTERLLDGADARGVMCPEFKRDTVDGRYYFIEWNPRPAYFQSLGWRAGFDLAWLAWCDHADPAQLPAQWPEGTQGTNARHYWINLQADLQHLACAPRSGLRPAYWRPYLGPYEPAVFALDDLRPWLRAMRNLAAWLATRSRRWAPLRAMDSARSTAARRLRGL